MTPDWGVHKYANSVICDSPNRSIDTCNDAVYIDVESVGLQTSDRLIGIGLRFGPDFSYYCTDFASVKNLVETRPLIGHNIKFDFKVLLANGFNVKPEQIAGDTMLMSYCLNPTKETHGLKPLAKELLGMEWPSYEDLTTSYETIQTKPTKKYPQGQTKRKRISKTLAELPAEVAANYNAMDVLATYRLYNHFKDKVGSWYEEVELPLLRLLIQMELNGMDVDVDYFRHLHEDISQQLVGLKEGIRQDVIPYVDAFLKIPEWQIDKEEHRSARNAWSKGEFNPGSSQQKITMLNFLGLDVESSDKKILVKKKEHPFVDKLLQYSELNGIVTKFLNRLCESGGHVSTTYNQVRPAKNVFDDDALLGIMSGRLSSSGKDAPNNLNLQQIPSRSEKGRQIRNGFIAPRGYKFGAFDYSQIELRIIAHFSQEPTFLRAFQTGIDLHEMVAQELGVERIMAKQANFLVSYGGGPQKLADVLNIKLTKAREFFKAYWEKYRGIKEWKERVVEEARRSEDIVTAFGRRIPIRELASFDPQVASRAERQAVSYLVQGTAADIIKKAMLRCYAEGFLPRLTVHDELGFYLADDGNLVYTTNRVKQIMEDTAKLSVPLIVEFGVADSWGGAKEDAERRKRDYTAKIS